MKQEKYNDIAEALQDAEQHIERLDHYEKIHKKQSDYVKAALVLLQERDIVASYEDVVECLELRADKEEMQQENDAEDEMDYQAQRDEEKFLNMGLC